MAEKDIKDQLIGIPEFTIKIDPEKAKEEKIIEPLPPNYSFFEIKYYAQFFDLSTQEALQRIKYSLNPVLQVKLVQIKPNLDLYVPIWISITFIFIYSIFFSFSSSTSSNTSTSNQVSNSTLTNNYEIINATYFFYSSKYIGIYFCFLPVFIYIVAQCNAIEF